MFKARIHETEKQLDIFADSYAKLNETLRTSLSTEASRILKNEYIDNNKWSGVINISICDLSSDQGIVLHLGQNEQVESETNPIPDFWEVNRDGLTYLVPINKKFCGPILTRLYDARSFTADHEPKPNNIQASCHQQELNSEFNLSEPNIYSDLQGLFEQIDDTKSPESELTEERTVPHSLGMTTKSYNNQKNKLS